MAVFVRVTSLWSVRRVAYWWASGRETNQAGGTAFLISTSDWLKLSEKDHLLIEIFELICGRPLVPILQLENDY